VNKRFIPISQYCRLTGLSYRTVDHMLNSGQLAYITTEAGLRRIDTQGRPEPGAVIARLDEQGRLLTAIGERLGIQAGEAGSGDGGGNVRRLDDKRARR